MATTCGVALASESQRRPQPFTPSPWGDFFLNHRPCTTTQLVSMRERARAVQEEVRKTILEATASSDLIRKLELVDTLQRIGVDYHYKEEIHELLHGVYDDSDDGGYDDLYLTSLRFYLLRKHGYTVSSDVFLKFRDEKGNISSDDVNCLMTLYDAAHMRTHGEQILDNIITCNKSRLQHLLKTNLRPDLADEVLFTLETPRFRRVERVEAQRYISVYEKQATRDETVLELAKLDYNILQALYCEELKELTIYSTTEESNIFTRAIERWDKQMVEQFPDYLKAILINILNATNKIEEDLKLQGYKHAEMFKKMVIDTARFYSAEVKWRDEHYIPDTIEEHLKISLPSSGCMQIATMAFILLGDVTSKEDVEWAFTFPKIIRGVCIVARIGNDIVSHEREAATKHVASTVQACMKQYGGTVEEANDKLRVIIEEAWMDMVEECLDQKHPMVLLEKAVNIARTMDFMYKREDMYTLSVKLKDVITSMYVNSV
ncbi:hypothetical protein PR202_gb28845 [Eleusine coracana subsp. coracana]|uniref:Uncharacterized protein n=1 Tax=Eleusine coracana subsp. coracana TaxID=191504 RepID=A0AAV5FYF8_ELECO|nr:hypothetical protein PR202_gb28845 [Eleusine coracana subsp. coracana]